MYLQYSKMENFIIICFMTLAVNIISSKGAPDNAGTEFYLTFPGNIKNYRTGKNVLFITSEHNSIVNVQQLGQPVQTHTVIAKKLLTLNFTASLRLSSGVENKGIAVSSDNEIVVYGISLVHTSTDAFLALPADIQSKEYRAVCFIPISGFATSISLVAGEHDTTVSITPPGERPVTTTLGRLQTFSLMRSTDLTGSKITTDKKISVFTGVECTRVGGIGACDHLVEQIPPVDTWGKRFATVPIAPRTLGDVFRVISSEDYTFVQLHTSSRSHSLQKAGQFWQFEIASTKNEYITCSKPCLVMQYNKGQDGNFETDPFMVIVPPIEQYASDYVLSTSQDANGLAFQNYLSIVIETKHRNNILIDGNLKRASWSQIPNTNLSAASFLMQPGRHNVYHQSPIVQFAAYMYGHRNYDSYGYPGGLRLAPIANPCKKSSMQPVDGIDNDCDGRIDEELFNDKDDDGDGLIDEDLGARPPVIIKPRPVNRPQVGTNIVTNSRNNVTNATNTTDPDSGPDEVPVRVCNFTNLPENFTQSVGQIGIKASEGCLKLGATEVNFTEQVIVGSACKKVVQQTWVITDGCKNVITYQQNVTVEIEEPDIDIAPAVTLNCSDVQVIKTQLKNNVPNVTHSKCPDAGSTGGRRKRSVVSIKEVTPEYLLRGACQGQTIQRKWEIEESCGRTMVVTQNVTLNKKDGVEVVCRENGVERECSTEDLLKSKLGHMLCENNSTPDIWTQSTKSSMTSSQFTATKGPCTVRAISEGNMFHGYPSDPTKYIQCDEYGRTYIKDCRPGQIWSQATVTCIVGDSFG